jgi:hypothetical protein
MIFMERRKEGGNYRFVTERKKHPCCEIRTIMNLMYSLISLKEQASACAVLLLLAPSH